MEFEAKQAYKIFETGALVWKSKKWSQINQFFYLVAFCLKVIEKLICLPASVILNAK